MESKLSLPTEKTEYGYELAYRLAREQLAKIDNLPEQCLKSGAKCVDSEKVTIGYLSQSYLITLPAIEVSLVAGEGVVPIRDRVLILHYFTRARGTPLSNAMITYKELPEGANYFPVFAKRAIKPLVDHFGKEPDRLMDVAAILGGYKVDYGDTAVTINAFSRVPVTIVLWKGDEEFAPGGNIIFDSTIPDYLSTEDVNVLCETIAWRLVRLKDKR